MDFETVEDAIVEQVRSELTYLRTVKSFDTEDSADLMAEMSAAGGRFPAAYVVYGGSDMEWVDGRTWRHKAKFGIVLAAQSLRGRSSAIRGGGVDEKGVNEMIVDTLTALVNQKLGLDIEKLRPGGIARLMVGKSVAAYAVSCETGWDEVFG